MARPPGPRSVPFLYPVDPTDDASPFEVGPEAVANMGQSQRLGARLALPMWQKAVYSALGA